jgi:predicted lipase
MKVKAEKMIYKIGRQRKKNTQNKTEKGGQKEAKNYRMETERDRKHTHTHTQRIDRINKVSAGSSFHSVWSAGS